MMLQTILCGSFTPPPVMATRKHTISDKEIKVKVKAVPVKKVRVYEVPEEVVQKRLYMVKYVRANPGKSTAELCDQFGCKSRATMRHWLLNTGELGYVGSKNINYWYFKADKPGCSDGVEKRVSHAALVRSLLQKNPQGITVKELTAITKKSNKSTYDALHNIKEAYIVREADSIQGKWFLK